MSAPIDVRNSLMQARWVLPEADMETVAEVVRRHNLPEMVARFIVARGIDTEDLESFLDPRLSRDFPDPLALKDMKELAAWLAGAISEGRKIGIVGDFDVDGATSTAILRRFLRHCGQEAPFYIPDRLEEGYGPNANAFKTLKEQGCDIVMILDCGITAFDVIAKGREMGLDIAVLDHHQAEETLPDANFVINPKRHDDESGFDMLAACGVVFLTCVATNAALRDEGWYKGQGIEEAPLKSWLDLLAMGTVCDMVPLKGPNRLFVKVGLQLMNSTDNAGIRALKEVCKVEGKMSPYTMGFIFGPRINAGSRVHRSDLGALLLSTDDYEEAKNVAWMLNDCNDKRKTIQGDMFDQAVTLVENKELQNEPLIFVDHKDWHPGLSGLVAGRLKERYNKPAVCVTYAEGESGKLEGRGSGRSIPGINIGAAFIDARKEGIAEKGGGHAMAAGFTVFEDQIDAFKEYVMAHIKDQMDGHVHVIDTLADAVLSVRGAQIDLVKRLQNQLGPFGQEHEEPLFILPSVRLHQVRVVGKDHISAYISDWDGGGRMKGIAFRAKDTPMGKAFLEQGYDKPFHLLGTLKTNVWKDRESVEMQIQDAAPAVGAAAEAQLLKNAGSLAQ